LPGRHNLRNALAAVAVGVDLGLEPSVVAAGLREFGGVGRRCEDHGEHGGVRVLDDYGHHPTEVLATLQVAAAGDRRLVVLFQPHRYSRTARFAREFGDALAGADAVGLLPVYAAGEEPQPGVDSGLVADALATKGTTVDLLPDADAIPAWLEARVRSGDLLLTLGAGDIGRRVADICRYLDERSDA
jgi:UDP-N-acetylmuramate--alanine ligase